MIHHLTALHSIATTLTKEISSEATCGKVSGNVAQLHAVAEIARGLEASCKKAICALNEVLPRLVEPGGKSCGTLETDTGKARVLRWTTSTAFIQHEGGRLDIAVEPVINEEQESGNAPVACAGQVPSDPYSTAPAPSPKPSSSQPAPGGPRQPTVKLADGSAGVDDRIVSAGNLLLTGDSLDKASRAGRLCQPDASCRYPADQGAALTFGIWWRSLSRVIRCPRGLEPVQLRFGGLSVLGRIANQVHAAFWDAQSRLGESEWTTSK